jgi:hypothetical protein
MELTDIKSIFSPSELATYSNSKVQIHDVNFLLSLMAYNGEYMDDWV